MPSVSVNETRQGRTLGTARYRRRKRRTSRGSIAINRNQYCYACYTSDYPADLVHIEELVAKGRRR
jgi:hypothetical protein